MNHMTYSRSQRPEDKRYYLTPIYGKDLERIGIRNDGGGFAIVDQNAPIRVGDLVHCGRFPGQIGGYIKQVKAIDGSCVTVGTAYADESKDIAFAAGEIYGLVIETYGKHDGSREYANEERSGGNPENALAYFKNKLQTLLEKYGAEEEYREKINAVRIAIDLLENEVNGGMIYRVEE